MTSEKLQEEKEVPPRADKKSDHAWKSLMAKWPSILVAVYLVGMVARITSIYCFNYGDARYFTPADDILISMQYAKNLAASYGLVWNAHDPNPVEGITNLLWTLALVPFHWLPIPASKMSLVVIALNTVLVLVVWWQVGLLCKCLGERRPFVIVAAQLLAAANPSMISYVAMGF